MANYLQLESGSGGYQLEDGSGLILLEDPMALATSLTDNFNSGSKDTTKWAASGHLSGQSATNTANATVSQTSGVLQIVINGSNGGDGYTSIDTLNLSDVLIFAKVTLSNPTNLTAMIGIGTPGGARIAGGISNNNTAINWRDGGTGFINGTAGSGYSSTAHAWIGLKYNSSLDRFELYVAPSTASNPPVSGDWTFNGAITRPASFSVGTGKIGLVGEFAVGTGTVTFDGFNTAT